MLGSVAHNPAAFDPFNPFNLTDCRDETSPYYENDGRLRVLSWHIHYTTNTSDQERFYNSFVDAFQSYFPAGGNLCPFGPNYGSETFKFICSLEDAYEEDWAAELAAKYERRHLAADQTGGSSPWSLPQRAFFVPLAFIEETWEWSLQNQGYLDVLRHPNTGCMYDDHSKRAIWNIGPASTEDPTIYILNFPCNAPATGCNDSKFEGAPSCGCEMPLQDDAPESSCQYCTRTY